ncbi:MAG: nucleotidyl transferase AbiEii/AbiGii toxin family protein [archaeon]|nr:nucleotidyl transferase AbiEii/AbiGii toxin family protein [archaeon]
MENILKTMMAGRPQDTQLEIQNSLREVMQEITLYALSSSGFFNEASFYGGTALRLFHGLDRYSEDLDFSLREVSDKFDLSNYIESLQSSFDRLGISVDVGIKNKSFKSKMESAFVKGNTKALLIDICPDEKISRIYPTDRIKVKFEIDTDPPAGAGYEKRFLLSPYPCEISMFDTGSLYAGKVHAILCRNWGHRFKGRDLYDLVFYVSRNISLNLESLRNRLIQIGTVEDGDALTLADVKDMLLRKMDEIDFETAKTDVVPFIRDERPLSVWSREFFVDVISRMI